MTATEQKTKDQLIEELSASRAELTVINAVQEALAGSLDMQGIYEAVGEQLRQIFIVQTVAIYVADVSTNLMHLEYAFEKGNKFPRVEVPLNSLYKYVLELGETFVKNGDFPRFAAQFKDYQVPQGEIPQSVLVTAVPSRERSEQTVMIGLLDIDSGKTFTETDVGLLETIANSMSVALENVRLFEETQRLLKETEERNAELAVINSVQTGLATKLDMQAIYTLIGDTIQEITHAAVVQIASWDWATRFMHTEYFRDGDHQFGVIERPLSALHDEVFPQLEKGETVIWNEGIEERYQELGHVVSAGKIPKTIVGIPLKIGGKTNSFISLQDTENEFAFSESTIRLVETLAGSMSVALENARLFDETTQRNAELAIVNSVSADTSRNLDVDTVVKIVGDKVQEIFGAEVVAIGLINEEKGVSELPYSYALGEYFEEESFPLGAGLAGIMFKTRQPLLLHTAKEINKLGSVETEADQRKEELIQSWLGVPIIIGDELIGGVAVQSYKPHAFTESDQRLLTTLSNNMGAVIRNARLFEETKHLLKETEERNAELAVINSVQEALAAQLDLQGIYDAVGDKIRDIFDAQSLIIGTLDYQTKMAHAKYFYEKGKRYFPESFTFSGLIEHIIETGEKIVINENMVERSKELNMITEGEEPLSGVWIPYKTGTQVRGIISLQNIDREHAFSESDVRLLETLANSMSVALENARLFDETSQRNAELALINTIQASLAAELDIQGIYDLVGEKIQSIFDAQTVMLLSTDLEKDVSTTNYMVEKGKRYYPDPRPLSGLQKYIVTLGETLLVNQNAEEILTGVGAVITHGEFPKSALFVPLKSGKTMTGLISLQNIDREHAFSENDVRLLETLANSLSVALENARLFDELQSSNKEISEALERQTAISEILHIISNSPGEIQPVLQAVAEHAATLCEADDVQIYRAFDDKIMEIAHFGPLPALRASETLPLDPGLLTGRSILERRTIHVDAGNLSAKEYPISVELQNRLKHRSVIITPLIREDEAIGAIVARRNEVRKFSQNQIALLSTFANQAAIAIENVRLFEETRRLLAESMQQADELQTVNTVSTALSSELELDALIELIGGQVQKIFDADIAYLALLDKASGYIEFPYSYGEEVEKLKFGDGLTSRVMKDGEPLLINQDDEWSKTKKRIGVEAQSYLGVPISVGKDVIGVISVQSTQLTNMYGEKEVRLLSTIAANIGAAIQNANLFKEVERRKEYFEALISSAPVAIITIGLDGNVTSWSPAAENLFGYTEEEAVGANIDDLVSNHPDVREEAEKLTQQYITDIGKIQLKSQRTHKDGRLIDVAINAMPVHIDGVVSGYIAIYNDVSELERARREAEEANHAKSAFLANMSHELRTPLNAIIGFTRIVKRKGEKILPDKQQENLEKVLVSAEHLLGLINTVLDISKIEAGRMEVHATNFDLKSLINLVAITSQPLLRDGNVGFRTEIPDDLPMITSDIEKIKQVLINLVSNAAKFTHEGEIAVEVRQVNDQIEIDVTDTGIGIPPDALEHIFEEFQQADSSTTREYGGTGLGLSISRSLAQLLEGDLRVVSEVGVGSKFTFSFSIMYGQKDEEPSAQSTQRGMEGDEPLILVIDDNEDAIYLMREMLVAAGYQVAVARNANHGLSLAGELMPFAITLDIMMPKKDGWQVLHDLKANPATKSIPVILISIVDQKALGYRLGAEDYLVKPLQEDEILHSLEHIKRRGGDKPLKRLLVVDDDPSVVDMISQLLEGKQYQVEAAFDGLDALEKIRTNKPDAILLDLMMPRLDGFGLIDHLKQDPALASLPVIVLTAKLLSQKEKDALRKTVGQVIQKQGISGEELLSEIRETIKNTV